MVKVMNNKRNSLKVLSALFAFCNLFSLVNTSAARKANVVSQNMEVKHSLPGNGFKILEFHNGIRLVYTSNVDYNTNKDEIFYIINKIKEKIKYKNFICFSLGRDNPVVVGINENDIDIFFTKIQNCYVSKLDKDLNDRAFALIVHKRLKNILPEINKFLEKNKRCGDVFDQISGQQFSISVLYGKHSKCEDHVLKELIPIIRELNPRYPNKRVTGKKGIDAGRFRLTYIGVDLNGYQQFKTRQGAWDVTVTVSEDGFALCYDKLDLGIYICPGCNPIYMYHIKKHIPNHETAEIKELSKTAFLSIYHAKTGKEFDYSMVNELQKLLKKNNLNHLHDHYNKNKNNLNSGSLSKIDGNPEYMQESN